MDKNQRAPDIHRESCQTLIFFGEIFNAAEFRRAQQAAGQVVGPAVVAAAEVAAVTLSFAGDPGSAMPAEIKKCPQRAGLIAHDQDRLHGQLGRKEHPRLGNLIGAADCDPAAAEYVTPLRRIHERVGVPRAWNRSRSLEGQRRVEVLQQLQQMIWRRMHFFALPVHGDAIFSKAPTIHSISIRLKRANSGRLRIQR